MGSFRLALRFALKRTECSLTATAGEFWTHGKLDPGGICRNDEVIEGEAAGPTISGRIFHFISLVVVSVTDSPPGPGSVLFPRFGRKHVRWTSLPPEPGLRQHRGADKSRSG